jgi:hypothetical protein
MAAVLFRLPAKPSVPFLISFGSRIIGQAADVLPDLDLPLHLPLDSRRFFRLPSATASSTEAVDAFSALGRLPHLLPGFRSGSRFLRLFHPRSRFVDEISALPPAPSL